MKPPSAEELLVDAVVQQAMGVAWADSFPEEESLRHEEGGYIFWNSTIGTVTIRRAPPGIVDELEIIPQIDMPPVYWIGVYHTHPNPTAAGWNPEPSERDRKKAFEWGVPVLILSDCGTYWIGPPSRIIRR